MGETWTIFTGGDVAVSLRDYLAAHAPAEPQMWFMPVMPKPRPGTRPAMFKDLEPVKAAVCQWISDDAGACLESFVCQDIGYAGLSGADKDRVLLAAEQYENAVLDWQRDRKAWDHEQRKQRLVQWPWAWADAVLSTRDVKVTPKEGQ